MTIEQDFVFVKQPDESYERHVFIRTKQANQLMENIKMTTPTMEQYAESQRSATIDNLTAHLATLNSQIKTLEDQLDARQAEREITKDILRGRLETTLGELVPQEQFMVEEITPDELIEEELEYDQTDG